MPEPKKLSDALDSVIQQMNAVEATCTKCGKPVGEVCRFAASAIQCDECYAESAKKLNLKSMKDWWRHFCPEQFRATDLKHEDFNKSAWGRVVEVELDRNLILVGASGTCKTRIMMERLKRCFLHGRKPSVLWADVLDEAIQSRQTGKALESHSEAPVLGIDDLFTAGSAFEAYTKLVKSLIDRRLRQNRVTIITTNLKARDIRSDSEKFANATRGDRERIEAIIRRLREEFVMVDCDRVDGKGEF